MTMASGLYVVPWSTMLKNTLAADLSASTNIVCLYLDAKTPAFNTDAAHSATSEVATANGYTQDAKTVGGTPTVAYQATARLKYTWSTTVQWTATGAGFTARGMIIGAASTLEPLVGVTFGADYTASGGGTFTITAHTDGIAYITMYA